MAKGKNNGDLFRDPSQRSIRKQNEWRSKYGGLSIKVTPFAFDTEGKYLSFIDDLGALLCAYGRLEDRT